MRACIDCKLAARVASSNAKTLHYRNCLNRADYCDVNKEPMTNILRPVSMALARQKYWQIRTNFTTLLPHNYNLTLDYKDYSKNLLASLTYLVFL